MRYLLALAATATALLLRWALDRYFGGALPYLPLLLATTFAAWYCGAWPAALSTVSGLVFAGYLFVLPEQSFTPFSSSHAASTLAFLLTAGAIIAIAEQNRRNLSRPQSRGEERNERGEKALREAEVDFDFELATRMAGVGIWMWDLRSKEIRWSDQQKALYAHPPDTPVNYDWFLAALHPDDRDSVHLNAQRSLREKTEYRGEFRIILPDGSTRWIGSRGRVVLDEQGKAMQIAGADWDITARRLAQEQLARSEARLRLAQAAVNIGTWEWDPDADVSVWSEQKYELFGIPPSDPLYEQTWMAAIADEDREKVKAIRQRAHRDECAEVEYRYRHPQKGWRWMYSRARMVPDGTGKRMMVGISLDITERKQVEEELRETAVRFQSTFEYANVGMAHVGLDGRYLRVNRKLSEMVGYSPEELMQLKIENITPPEYVEEDLRQKQRLISGEASAVQREKAYIRKNGSRVSVRVMVAPLPAADGAPQYLILVVEEIRGLETASSELAP